MHNRIILAAGVCVTLLLLISVSASTDEDAAERPSWPAHHGADRSNMSAETGLLRRWPEGGPPPVWTYDECGGGYSGVAIADGMIFTAGDFADDEKVLALDMEGRLLWSAPNGKSWNRSSPGSRTTPTYDDGRVYQLNPFGRLASYDAKTGREIWAVDLKAEFDAHWGIWGLAENVLIDGDKLLCMPGGERGRVVALDKNTGETIWANTQIAHTAAYCSPVVVTHGGKRQMLTMTQKSVVGIEVATGELAWSVPFVPRSPQNALTPLYHDGHVFVACGHSTGGRLLKIDQPARSATTVWHRKDLDNCHAGSLLVDGKLYGASCRVGGKHFFCVDFLTGETIKLDRTLGKVGMTTADGMIYCLGYRGQVSLLAITPDGFEIVSQFNLPRKPVNTYLAHPVVCGGRLYLRGGPELYVYDIRDRKRR